MQFFPFKNACNSQHFSLMVRTLRKSLVRINAKKTLQNKKFQSSFIEKIFKSIIHSAVLLF